ncbi:MAG: ATP-dependent helicase HrpB [Parvularculaceae bacterium]|nr:ATP-dependent helicase HrpB [Parvularculaceae bacterium]
MDVDRRALSMIDAPLPIDEALPRIKTALREATRLVLAAPPGAGKTTRVPLALLGEDWLAGRRIMMLEPRRIAARMAAERMAAILGERVGETIGLSTRIDRRVSAKTRIEVVTDGLFTRRILAQPDLPAIGAVLFDEYHERSLAADLGLALARDAQGALREDLRLVLMSATLDVARVAAAFDAAVVESQGRAYPVETIYLGKSNDPIEDQTACAVRRALREQAGSVLVFLPGVREISRTAERLADLPPEIDVAPLFGALAPAEQDRAVSPAPAGRRKVVVATDIAESSLTIEGVSAVVDAGLARIAEHDPAAGVDRLVTRKASRASVDQRRGRAGRLGPGVCYRLWDEEATRGLAAEPTPGILSSSLASLALALAEWGEADAARLSWIDAPPPGRLEAARLELRRLRALDGDGALTALGRDMARLPLDPPHAAMVAGANLGADRALAALIAIIVSERGLGGGSTDLRERVERFKADRGARAEALRKQAAHWSDSLAPGPASNAGTVLAQARPAMIAKARPDTPGAFQLANGRIATLDKGDPLAGAPWLAVADLAGDARSARILLAAPLSEDEALAVGGVETAEIAAFDIASKSVKARRVKRLGAIVLEEAPLPSPPKAAVAAALAEAVRSHGLDLLPQAGAIRAVQARVSLARTLLPELTLVDDAALLDRLDEWIAPLLGDPPSLDRATEDAARRAVLSLIDWNDARKLDELAPTAFAAPSGRMLTIDYLAPGGPAIEARAQEFFGLAQHPSILKGSTPLVVSLLSPAHRQIALTKDLPRFWREGYLDMAKDMRGRYPKHDWPADPAGARPHEGKTKKRLGTS